MPALVRHRQRDSRGRPFRTFACVGRLRPWTSYRRRWHKRVGKLLRRGLQRTVLRGPLSTPALRMIAVQDEDRVFEQGYPLTGATAIHRSLDIGDLALVESPLLRAAMRAAWVRVKPHSPNRPGIAF